MKFQKTFTVGEAMIVSQGITLLLVMSVTRYVFSITEIDEEMEFINTIIYVSVNVYSYFFNIGFGSPSQ